jgi:hypothetical protein
MTATSAFLAQNAPATSALAGGRPLGKEGILADDCMSRQDQRDKPVIGWMSIHNRTRTGRTTNALQKADNCGTNTPALRSIFVVRSLNGGENRTQLPGNPENVGQCAC